MKTDVIVIHVLIVVAALCAVMGQGGAVRAEEARIDGFVPSDRIFYPGEDVKLRIVMMLDRPQKLQDPEVRYEVVELVSGRIAASGAVRFNQVLASGGWAELVPDLPEAHEARWYRVELALWDVDRPIPIAGGAEGRAKTSFGVVPADAGVNTRGGAQGDPVVPTRKVMAFYYTWYGNPTVSGSWVHWPEGGHHPDASDERGLPDLGATHHPALGPYDSNDPRLIRQHLAWAERAGIDVLIATWWGQGSFSDRALGPLLEAAADTRVRISLYYETVPGSGTEGVLRDLRYLLSIYGEDPALFRHEGEPVIFVYSRALAQLEFAAWQRVIETIKAEYGVKLIADSTDGRWAEIFDGLHTYNPVGQVVGQSDMRRVYESLVWAAESHGKITSVTVIPGYDDSNIGRPTPIVAPRWDGDLYDELWALAIESRPEWVLITSFNEWHEGSEIEPSIEYGDRFLRSTAAWTAQFRSASERTLWPRRVSMPAVVARGREYPVHIEAVRTAGEGQIEVSWRLPHGWTVRGVTVGGETPGESTVDARITAPKDAEPGLYSVAAMLSWKGYVATLSGYVTLAREGEAPFDGVGVWAELGPENQAFGLIQRDHADGVTAAANVAGAAARRTAPGVSSHKYMYFDVADSFLFDAKGAEVEIGIEYLDNSTGSFQVQYDSSNPLGGPLNGAYTNAPAISLRDSGEWATARVLIRDARFANRQNGGTDFRLAVGSGDLMVRRVYVRVLGGTPE